MPMEIQDSDSNISVGLVDIGSVKNNHGDDEVMDDVKAEEAAETDRMISWRSLLENSISQTRQIRGSNYVQLATVDIETMEPRCRCVVFRGFLHLEPTHSLHATCDDKTCLMRMCTDRRSDKVHQILRHPTNTAEIVWWFPTTNEQYRIRGKVILIGGGGDLEYDTDNELQTARLDLWGKLSPTAKESFFAPDIPGKDYVDKDDDVTKSKADDEGTDAISDSKSHLASPPNDFLMMLLIPNHCDYLRLTNMYRQIDTCSSSSWHSQRVNP